jgi:hypothetical protein
MKTTEPTWDKTVVLSKLTLLSQALIVLLAFTLSATAARADNFAYVVALSSNGPQFGAVELGTGRFVPIGKPEPVQLSNLVWWKGSLLSLAASDPHAGDLVRINPSNGKITVIGATGLGYNAFDLAEAGGKLYLTDFSNNFYSVDPHTGAATLIAATGMPPDPNTPFTSNPDGTFNLCDESLYSVGGNLFATFDSFNVDPVTLLVDKDLVDSTVSPALYRVDPSTGAATLIGPTNLQLGATIAVDGKFYAFRQSFTGFVDGFPQAFSELVSLDLTTGKATFLRIVDPDAGVIFGAAPVVP